MNYKRNDKFVRIAVQFAIWMNPYIALLVSKWVRKLLREGVVKY